MFNSEISNLCNDLMMLIEGMEGIPAYNKTYYNSEYMRITNALETAIILDRYINSMNDDYSLNKCG